MTRKITDLQYRLYVWAGALKHKLRGGGMVQSVHSTLDALMEFRAPSGSLFSIYCTRHTDLSPGFSADISLFSTEDFVLLCCFTTSS